MLKKDKALFYHQRILGRYYLFACGSHEIYLRQCGTACVKHMTGSSIVSYGLKHKNEINQKINGRKYFIWSSFMDLNKLRLWDTAHSML